MSINSVFLEAVKDKDGHFVTETYPLASANILKASSYELHGCHRVSGTLLSSARVQGA